MLENITPDQWLLYALSVIASALLGLMYHRVSPKQYRILYDIDSDAIALESERSDIEYRFAGEVVPSIYRTQLRIRSFGNTVIEPSELSSAGSLDFVLGQHSILKAFLWDGQIHSASTLEVSKDRSAVSIRTERIGPGDNFRVSVFTSRPVSKSIECRTYVLGRSRSIRRVRSISEMITVGIAIITPALVGIQISVIFGSDWFFSSWLGSTIMFLALVIAYGGGLFLAYEQFLGAHAKMRRMKYADMIPMG